MTSWDEPSLSLHDMQRVEQVCDLYEELLRNKQRPRLEQFIGDAAEPLLSKLLHELLALEIDYRAQDSDLPTRREYTQRFPEHLEVIDHAFHDAGTRGLTTSLSFEELRSAVTSNGLIARRELRSLLDEVPGDSRPQQGDELARALAQAGKLSRFQLALINRGQARDLLLGEYVLVREIGAGGMGQVFEARYRRGEERVAIKILPVEGDSDRSLTRRFRREIRLATRLRHPNIVRALSGDHQGGQLFLVMELIDGEDLKRLVRRDGPLAIGRAIDYAIQAARGMEYSHQQGVVHRDLKPGNLMVSASGTVKVLDLGLARATEPSAEEGSSAMQLTRSGDVMGTINYMAPEQAEDARTSDHRADIFSLGCTLHFMLSGRSPCRSFSAHTSDDDNPFTAQPNPLDVASDLPHDVQRVLEKMLARKPAARHQSMAEVIQDLEPLRTRYSAGVKTADAIRSECDFIVTDTDVSDSTTAQNSLINLVNKARAAFGRGRRS